MAGAIVGCDLILWLGLLGMSITAGMMRTGDINENPNYDSWKNQRTSGNIVTAALVFSVVNT